LSLTAAREVYGVVEIGLAREQCVQCAHGKIRAFGTSTLSASDIVEAQAGAKGLFDWFWLPLLPMFVIYFVSGVAETNRAPFDVAEGESEIVAGFHVEYSGAPFAVFFLTEYANMILVSFLAPILFLGGWLSPIPFAPFTWVPGLIWFALKASFLFFMIAMVKAMVPRYRYDQLMRIGWKVFLPISLVMVVIVAFVLQLTGWGWNGGVV
jgi:NADH-quinone oxidoreductase subunit H